MTKQFAKFYDYVDLAAPKGLRIPDEPKEKAKFIDNFVANKKGLIATVRATHAARLTRNNGLYLPDKMRKGSRTMVSRERGGSEPYDKPVLINHESHLDAIGRIVAADYIDVTQQARVTDSHKSLLLDLSQASQMWRAVDIVESLVKTGILFDEDWTGLGYIKAACHITDADAIEKILDRRYLTVSTGAGSDKAICSVCQEDWVAEGAPCEHRPGKDYDGQRAFLIAGNLFYDELSYVNRPADTEAVTTGVQLIDIPVGNGNYQPVAVDNDDLRKAYVCDIYVFDDSEDSKVETREELLNKLTDTFKHLEDSKLEELKLIEDDAEFQKAVEDMLEAKELIDKIVAGEATYEDAGLDGSGGNLEVEQLIRIHNSMHYSYEYDLSDGEITKIPKAAFALHSKLMDIAVSGGFRDDIINGKLDSYDMDGKLIQDSADGDNIKKILVFDDIDIDKKEFTDEEVECINDAIEAEILDMIEDGTECTAGDCLVSLEDAKLSTSKRKSLPSSSFCGPNRSFPVPDCAHVTAARRLIGRYKGPGSKDAILSCVSRKAKAMGCGSKSNDSTEGDANELDKLALASATVFELSVEDQKCLCDVMVHKLVEAGVVDADLEKKNERLEGELEDMQTQLDDSKEQLKWLRAELSDIYSDYNHLSEELETSKADVHRLLAQNTSLVTLHNKGQDSKYEDVFEAQSNKPLGELQQEFKDMQDDVDFDGMIVRSGQDTPTDPPQVEDPTLSSQDNTEDQHDNGTSDRMKPDKWTDQVIKQFKEALKTDSDNAHRILRDAKRYGLVPSDFDITPFLDSSE